MNSTLTVACANKVSTKKIGLVGKLLRTLAVRQQVTKSTLVVTISITGKEKTEADNTSRYVVNKLNRKDRYLTNEKKLFIF